MVLIDFSFRSFASDTIFIEKRRKSIKHAGKVGAAKWKLKEEAKRREKNFSRMQFLLLFPPWTRVPAKPFVNDVTKVQSACRLPRYHWMKTMACVGSTKYSNEITYSFAPFPKKIKSNRIIKYFIKRSECEGCETCCWYSRLLDWSAIKVSINVIQLHLKQHRRSEPLDI